MNHAKLHKPFSLHGKHSPRLTQPVSPQKIKSMIPPTTQSPKKPSGPPPNVDPRKFIVDQIIRDCYSKQILRDGRQVLEIRYNTHLGIREYSQFPQAPPPPDVPPSQVGLIKNRILVLCTKLSGRILLQKGKYNDVKHIYQVGRLWDLDELRCITRVSHDSLILLLNKDYYWKSAEGPERFIKFVHHLASIYSKFTGGYPELKGFTLQELGLPPLANTSSNQQSSSGPVVPPQSASVSRLQIDLSRQRVADNAPVLSHAATDGKNNRVANHYKEMDFTSNGKLPMKPMLVMDVDRPSSNAPRSMLDPVPPKLEAPKNVLPQSLSVAQSSAASLNDSHSFVFGVEDKVQDGKVVPTITEYANATGRTLPLRNYSPERHLEGTRKVSEPLESAAAYSLQLQAALDKKEDALPRNDSTLQENSLPKNEQFPKDHPLPKDSLNRVSDAFEDAIQYDEHSLSSKSDQIDPTKVHIDNEPFPEQVTPTEAESIIDNSIREIQSYMDTEFAPSKTILRTSTNQPVPGDISQTQPDPALETPEMKSVTSVDKFINLDSLSFGAGFETPVTDEEPPVSEVKFDKDPEVDEMLDEIGWNVTEGSDQFIKKLSTELNNTKRKNIAELINLDFGKDSFANEIRVSDGEVHNLFGIFKKMEVQFSMIDSEINDIENNSRGLQVKAVNKKLLFNELSEILNKVRVSTRDLDLVAHFIDFKDIDSIPKLESKLLVLYGALKTFGGASEDDFSNMEALKQFKIRYEATALSFMQHFSDFIRTEFKKTVVQLKSDVSLLYSRSLFSSLKHYLIYVGITNFVRCVSYRDLEALGNDVRSFLVTYLTSVLNSLLKSIHQTSSIPKRLSESLEFGTSSRKSKISRFGSSRLSKRASSNEEANHANLKTLEGTKEKASGEITDYKTVMSLVAETRDLMLKVQFFLGLFFHLSSPDDFDEALKNTSFEERLKELQDPDLDEVNYKSNSNELLKFMTAVFGDYVNGFISKVTPSELIIPQLLVELHAFLIEATNKDQDFIAFSFIGKLIERYKRSWNKLISRQVHLLNKSDIRSKGEVLPVVRNINQIVLSTETTLEESFSYKDSQDAQLEVEHFINNSYSELTAAAVDLFSREDPLLKTNAHDEKERAHRNVAILQNVFTVIQQLDDLNSARVDPMKHEMNTVFKRVEKEYFNHILHRYFNKMTEFVHTHGDFTTRKKTDKILIKTLASTHTSKDVQPKIIEMHRKLERHVVISNTVFEQDLLRRLWTDLESELTQLFQTFDKIIRGEDRDTAVYVSVSEVRRYFLSAASS